MNLLRLLSVYFLFLSAALASPGAHGPNGEHLDAPGGAHVHGTDGPRIEAFSESFELVGRLQGEELSIYIDRYDTNEPVLGGALEVEFGAMKAPARFHADHGDYALDDKAFLKALAAPGKHALMFTLTAGAENDLLEGVLEVKPLAHADTHDTGHSRAGWIAGGALLAAALAALIIMRSRRKSMEGR